MKKFSDKILPSHRRAIRAISKCRTGELGFHIDQCQQCDNIHLFFHSCSNRSCPQCHAGNTRKWLKKKQSSLLPVPHFHVVFTLPCELRLPVRSHQTELFNCLFKAAVHAIFKLMADPRFGGGIPGMIGVLHTWTRDMNYHPHLHFLVPAGVISEDGTQWLPSKDKKFLVPVEMLSEIFRARFMKLARKALPQIDKDIPQSVWSKPWVVYLKPFIKGGRRILEYLARYVYKIAISNNRILSDNDGQITFKYQNSKSGKWKTMTLAADEFIRRFLQHVLPMGFHKVRSYGFFAPKYKKILETVKLGLETSTETSTETENATDKPEESEIEKNYRLCPKCKTGAMLVLLHVFITKIEEENIFLTKTKYLHFRGPPWKY